MPAKGFIVARVLPLSCFLFSLPCYINVYTIIMHEFTNRDTGKCCNRNSSSPKYSPLLRQIVRDKLFDVGKCPFLLIICPLQIIKSMLYKQLKLLQRVTYPFLTMVHPLCMTDQMKLLSPYSTGKRVHVGYPT